MLLAEDQIPLVLTRAEIDALLGYVAAWALARGIRLDKILEHATPAQASAIETLQQVA